MMLRKRSSRWAVARVLFVLPLAGLALGAFARTAYVFPDDKGKKENPNNLTLLFVSLYGRYKINKRKLNKKRKDKK